MSILFSFVFQCAVLRENRIDMLRLKSRESISSGSTSRKPCFTAKRSYRLRRSFKRYMVRDSGLQFLSIGEKNLCISSTCVEKLLTSFSLRRLFKDLMTFLSENVKQATPLSMIAAPSVTIWNRVKFLRGCVFVKYSSNPISHFSENSDRQNL